MAKRYQRGKQTLNRRTDNTMANRYQRGKQTLNRRTDYAMATIYQRGKHKPQIKGQTIQWPKDTKEVNRNLKSKDRQYNGQKIPKR